MFLLFFNLLIRFGMIFKFRPAESYQIANKNRAL